MCRDSSTWIARLGIKAVLFDIDDTLFDHIYSTRCAVECLIRRYPAGLGSRPSREVERMYHEALDEVYPKVMAGEMTLETARLTRIKMIFERFGISAARAECEECAERFRDVYFESRRPGPGAIVLLESLRRIGMKIGVVSNNLHQEQLGKLRFCKLDGLIDVVVTSEAAGISKPDERIFRTALDRIGCEPHEAIMIGDSWTSDIVGARRAGLYAIWYNSYESPRPEGFPEVPETRSFAEVQDLLLNSTF